MKFLYSLLLTLFIALPALGQGVRIDPLPVSTVSGQPIPGMAYPSVLAIPGSVVNLCTYPANGNPCTNYATTYTDSTLTNACPINQQIVLNGQTTCQAVTDNQGNFGFWVAPGNYTYQITLTTGASYGPFSVSAGGSSSSGGVSSINTFTGPFQFSGGGVSCTGGTPNICNFTTGGGVNPGPPTSLAYYDTTSTVRGDPLLDDTTPTVGATSTLIYSGNNTQFNTLFGGTYSNITGNAHASQFPNSTSQIQLRTNLTVDTGASSNAQNDGLITINTTDTAGVFNGANILISTSETNTKTLGTQSAANIFLQTNDTGNSDSNSGNISLVATAANTNNGEVFIESTHGNIELQAGNQFTLFATNLSIDGTGSIVANNDIRTAGHFNSAQLVAGCLAADVDGNIITQLPAAPCGSGGGGSGITGLTAGFVPLAGSATTLTANSHLDEITNAGFDTFSQDVIVADTSGIGGSDIGTEGTAPTAGSGIDTLYANSTAHRWTMNNNNSGAIIIGGITGAGTAGDTLVLASNGIDYADSGNHPGTGFTPTHTGDSGAGTGGSLSITFVTGANDDNGYINLTTGVSPAASAGVITVTYGGTYSAARKCSVAPASALATALGGNGFYVGSGTSTSTSFVIDIGATPLPANTTGYVIYYRCGN